MPPGAPEWAQAMIRQLRQILTQIENPQRPTRLAVFADVASLPPADQWENTLIRVVDVGSGTQGLAYSDGTNWRRADTNATL
jgi:hypothetical protein